jgi:hypothetical protein
VVGVDLCSSVSRAVAEPLAGTAPEARLWVLVEQPGPWGRDALLESHLPADLGRSLQEWSAGHSVRLGLIRRVGRHADTGTAPPRRQVLVARTDPGRSWLWNAPFDDPWALLDHDPARLIDGPPPDGTSDAPVLLVCTNARRDRCCALLGRPVAAELEETFEGEVWETSHLGGHRFAPTLVSLPDGYLYGGPDAATMSTSACRGRSSLPAAGQLAELAVLTHLGVARPHALDVVRAEPAADDLSSWLVTTPTGETLAVRVQSEPSDTSREESCGKALLPWRRHVATILA